ncbi:MAG: hypothetical protein QM755_17095 [Luteolibacter sp.]
MEAIETLEQRCREFAEAHGAATYCLPFAALEALAVLERLSKGTGPIAFSAAVVVQQWNKGQLNLL